MADMKTMREQEYDPEIGVREAIKKILLAVLPARVTRGRAGTRLSRSRTSALFLVRRTRYSVRRLAIQTDLAASIAASQYHVLTRCCANIASPSSALTFSVHRLRQSRISLAIIVYISWL